MIYILIINKSEYEYFTTIDRYVLPLTTIAYLYVRMSREIEVKEGPLAVIMYEARSRTNSNGSPRSVR